MGKALGTKLYYSIGEVADLTSLAPYTLRAWEGEFACLRPKRVRGKNRAYRERDISIVLLIRRLLHEERYSTRGAQQRLRNEPELIRGAVANLARLAAGDAPTLEELTAAGAGETLSQEVPVIPEAESSERNSPESSPPDSSSTERRVPSSAPSGAIDAERALLVTVRDELREILRILR